MPKRLEYSKRRDDAEAHSIYRNAKCPNCGKQFAREYHAKGMQICCSIKCANEYRQKYNKPLDHSFKLSYQCVCPVCNKHFETTTNNRCCSNECSDTYRKTPKAYMNISKEKICKNCGITFVVKYGDKRNKYCSFECQVHRNAGLSHRNRKYRLKNAMIDSDITLKQVMINDNNICYLCNKEVNPNDYYIRDGRYIIGDDYPSIDHIMPISKGGLHSWNNVRLAHMRCNTLKSNDY